MKTILLTLSIVSLMTLSGCSYNKHNDVANVKNIPTVYNGVLVSDYTTNRY